MRKWGWHAIAVLAGCGVAAGLAVAGQWEGGVAGAALIAAGGFWAPELAGWLGERRERVAAGLAARAELHARVTEGPAAPAGGAAFWLRPEQRAVGFIGRPELARLRRWCANPQAARVLLLTGAGGVGKTRLALQLAQDLGAEEWLCRVVAPEAEADVVAAARAVTAGPILLVVDYAEIRTGLGCLLKQVAADTSGGLRVLLIARGVGEWWVQLEASQDVDVRQLAISVEEVRTGVLPADAGSGADLVSAAVPAFAHALGLAVPSLVAVEVPSGQVPILVLHAAALVAVLRAHDPGSGGQARVVADEQVLTELLARERVFWLGSARTAGLSGAAAMDSVTAAQTVAVVCLMTPADEAEAAAALRRVTALTDAPAATVLRVARWLRQLYPAGHPDIPQRMAPWCGSLQPDVLAEHHVVAELAAAPALAAACLRDLTPAQARDALTVLARACAHRTEAPGVIAAALRADLPGLGQAAAEVSVQTGGSLGTVLADVVRDAEASLDVLIQIEQAIPYPTVVLAQADAIVTGRIVEGLPADAGAEVAASWRERLGAMLSQAGQTAGALPPALEAVAAYRQLDDAVPGYRAALAHSLDTAGVLLSDVGRLDEALTAAYEAVNIYRELAGAAPDRYRPDLAHAQCNLGIWLAEAGRAGEALAVTDEAVAIHRELASISDQYRPDLAESLSSLAVWLWEVGRTAEALAMTDEAIAIYRELATASPDRYRPALAATLHDLGARLSGMEHPADALAAVDEAVSIYQELAADHDRYRADLARALGSRVALISALPQPTTTALDSVVIEPLPELEAAAARYRTLAAADPGRYRPALACALDALSACLFELDHPEEALWTRYRALDVHRELAAESPWHVPGLCRSLDAICQWFAALGRPAATLPYIYEAIGAYRELCISYSRYRPYLARSLDSLSGWLYELGRLAEALEASKEAMTIRASLSR